MFEFEGMLRRDARELLCVVEAIVNEYFMSSIKGILKCSLGG